ncbi:MAG: phosphoribosyltransferase family protein [Chloroflexota bacterium]
MDQRFLDRVTAGERLASRLTAYRHTDSVVVGMARGGVPVGFAVAERLHLPLRALVIRKLGAPRNPELAIGAVSETGAVQLDPQVIQASGATAAYIEAEMSQEMREARRRQEEYATGPDLASIEGRTAIITDDGIATGSSAVVAVKSARDLGARTVVLAVPVASRQSIEMLEPLVDRLVVLAEPDPFLAVGLYYQDFGQVSDAEVISYLSRASKQLDDDPNVDVEIPAGEVILQGILGLPEQPHGIVLFAHGSGSGRFSPRNQMVARALHEAGLATVLLDLLTPSESEDRRLVFDIGLLAQRLVAATDWVGSRPDTASLPISYFGASTGGGAALVAAAQRPDEIRAVVSRGGRPDLAGPALEKVRAPTLLIVGGADEQVILLNERAMDLLTVVKELVIVPGATHLFEEPGALEEVARLAADWFNRVVSCEL